MSPRFTWTPLTMAEALLGDAVTLECAAEAWPVPRVTWQRHGGQLPVNRHRYVLGPFIVQPALLVFDLIFDLLLILNDIINPLHVTLLYVYSFCLFLCL